LSDRLQSKYASGRFAASHVLTILLLTLAICLGWSAPARAARTAAIIIDADSGEVLYEDRADEKRYPASLTKMMTVYLLFEAVDAKRLTFQSRLPVSARAAAQAPTKLGLRAGDTISVRDVILALIVKSANDAAVVAAEALGGSEERFAQMMTAKARKLGMTKTTFRNASGLPDGRQVTTARDLAVLARALIRDFPHHYHLFSVNEFTYGGRTHVSHNRLNTWYDGADGIKTGYIRASGFNLAASAKRGDRRLIGIVMGGISPSARDQRMAQLFDAAFAAPVPAPEIRQARVTSSGTKTVKAVKTVKVANAQPAARAGRPARTATREVDRNGDDASWGVQVGAFRDVDPARRATEQAVKLAPTYLSDAKVELVPVQRRQEMLYRARFVGLTETAARKACSALKKRRMSCITLSPDETINASQIAAHSNS